LSTLLNQGERGNAAGSRRNAIKGKTPQKSIAVEATLYQNRWEQRESKNQKIVHTKKASSGEKEDLRQIFFRVPS